MRSLFHLGYGEIAITAWIMNALRSTFFGTARLASSLTHEATEWCGLERPAADQRLVPRT